MRSRWLAMTVVLAACEAPTSDATGEPWTLGQMPAKRLESAATALGGRLAIYGGFATSDDEVPPRSITSDVITFNTLDGEWATLPSPPVAFTHANLAATGGALLLLGGLEGQTFEANGSAFILEAEAAEWTALPAMPEKQERGAAAVVAVPGHVFLLGGSCNPATPACSESTSNTGFFANTLDFDLATRTWSISPFPAIPGGRSHAAALREVDGTFVIAGGENQTGVLPFTHQLAFGDTEWTAVALMPTARSGCAYGAVFGQLVCAGGNDNTGALRVVESYDPTLDVWTTRPEMPEPRAGARGAVVASRLYAPGGSASLAFTPTDSLFVFNPVGDAE